MTYLELRDFLDGLSPRELAQTVTAYSGDIDDAIRICGTSINSEEDMGEVLEGYDKTQVFLVLA